MKKLIIVSVLYSVAILPGCGNSFDKERVQADSAAINAKPPDSSFNSTNNQNAHAGLPGTDSAEATHKDSTK